MLLKHDIYGEFNITEDILIELLNSPALLRLKGIDQGGYTKDPLLKERNRYNHSVGVMLLLRKYNASLEAQISGLLHDISHYAFSHAIDCILEDGDSGKQDLQDRSKKIFVEKSNIPEILEKYGYNPEYILNEENFPLLENHIPDICADRLDYSLPDIHLILKRDDKEIKVILKHLKVEGGKRWYFDDAEVAHRYANYFNQLNEKIWASFSGAVMFKSLKDFVKHALEMGYIHRDDLEKDDNYVLNECLKHVNEDRELKLYWERMNSKNVFSENRDEYEDVISLKSRVIDPYCLVNNKFKRVSEIYPQWKEVVKKEICVKKYYIKIND